MKKVISCALIALGLFSLATPALAQKAGDRRIATYPNFTVCEIYKRRVIDMQGRTALGWEAMDMDIHKFASQCANAINLRQYLASQPVVTIEGVDHIVSAIRERRGMLPPGDFTHGCGKDGLVYDICPDGSTALHRQSLRAPVHRCRIKANPRQYNGGVANIIASVGTGRD